VYLLTLALGMFPWKQVGEAEGNCRVERAGWTQVLAQSMQRVSVVCMLPIGLFQFTFEKAATWNKLLYVFHVGATEWPAF